MVLYREIKCHTTTVAYCLMHYIHHILYATCIDVASHVRCMGVVCRCILWTGAVMDKN